MKSIFKYWRVSGIFLVLLFIMSCKKFVEIHAPSTLLVSSGVFSDNTNATSAQTVIYSQMSNNAESFNMSRNSGLLSDELINYSAAPIQSQFYKNAMTALNRPGPWTNAYNYIYEANAIIEGLEGSKGVSQSVNQQLTGESKFVRAFWYFYLINCYGDIPLLTNTNYASNARLARSSREQVYRQVIEDLKDAQRLVSSNYVDFSNTTVTTERTRPTQWAATALLARAYLYTGKYDSAETAAAAVINHTDLYGLEPDLDNVFRANSQETIWQLQIPLPGDGTATADGYNFILQGQPTGSRVSISAQLLNSFEPGDSRRTNWISDTSFAGNPYSYSYKYKLAFEDPPVTEYVMVLRLAEQYLIRAESRAQQKNLSGAASDLNIIRNRAGLPNTTAATQTDLLTAILHERQTELFTEWGHRWFDLIRTNSANAVMSVVTPLKGGTWSTDGHQQVYPIPQSEISRDQNLTQNNGY